MSTFKPAYLRTYSEGRLTEKIQDAQKMLRSCILCPRGCHVNRLADETGICKTGKQVWVSSFSPHFGEEAPLVGQYGSGTIFFTHCNLLCNFCQNYDISHQGVGEKVSDEQLAQMMLVLQNRGCHNINFVTPSHVIPQILAALKIAIEGGLRIPLIYNTGGYDSVESLKLLEGVFDIYMPDVKFGDTEIAKRTCNAPDYPDVVRKAVLEMHRQVGELVVSDSGIAQRGLLIRHLVMPNGLAGTRSIMRFIAQQVSPRTYVNIMAQYHPCGQAYEIPKLDRRLSDEEFETALHDAQTEGITRLDRPRIRGFRVL